MQTPNPEYSPFLVRLWRDLPASIEPSATECEWLVQVEHISPASPTGTAPPATLATMFDGSWFTSTVVFSGTVTDGGSGVAAVEVSLDGGFTWQLATVDGADWELTWEVPEDLEFVSYPVRMRARDQAGKSTPGRCRQRWRGQRLRQ